MAISPIKSSTVTSVDGITLCWDSFEITFERETERYACSAMEVEQVSGKTASWSGSFSGVPIDPTDGISGTGKIDEADGDLSCAFHTASGKILTFSALSTASANAFVTSISATYNDRDVPKMDVQYAVNGAVTFAITSET